MNLETALENAFQKIVFEPGELSFLAATSKIELPIRDRLSWRLQQELNIHDVVREWRRADIAILKNDEPLAVIELKAMYTFDATLNNITHYVNLISGDEQKAIKLVGPNVPIFTILLAANPKPNDPTQLKSFIKYGNWIKEALKTANYNQIAVETDKVVKNSFLTGKQRSLVFYTIVKGNGGRFDIPFDVHVWCFRYEP